MKIENTVALVTGANRRCGRKHPDTRRASEHAGRRCLTLDVPDRGSFYGGDDRGYIDYPFLEEPAPALRRLVLAAGGRAEHLAFTGDRSPSPSCC